MTVQCARCGEEWSRVIWTSQLEQLYSAQAGIGSQRSAYLELLSAPGCGGVGGGENPRTSGDGSVASPKYLLDLTGRKKG